MFLINLSNFKYFKNQVFLAYHQETEILMSVGYVMADD